MTIAVRASNHQAQVGSTIVVTKPTGTVNGDMLFLYVFMEGDDVVTTPPSGFTLITANTGSAASDAKVAVYYKVAFTEPSTYTFTMTGGDAPGAVGAAISFSGTLLSLNQSVTSTGGADTSMVSGSLTPTVTSSMLIYFGNARRASGFDPATSTPSGMTLKETRGYYALRGSIWYETLAGTSAVQRTSTVDSSKWATVLLNIREVLPDATVSPPAASLTFTALAPTVTAVTLVTVDNAPTVAFSASEPTITTWDHVNVAVDNTPSITWTALDPEVFAGVTGEVFVTNSPSITFEALAPTVTVDAHVTVDDVPTIVFSASAPTVETLVTVNNVPTVTWTALAPDVTVDVIVAVDGSPTVTFTALEPSDFGSVASVAYRNAVLADAPYLYYRLEETSGTTVTDSSGNGRHGTYSGSPALATTAGKFSNTYGVALDGSNDMISRSGLPTSTPYSVEFWIKMPMGSPFPGYIIYIEGASGSNQKLHFFHDGGSGNTSLSVKNSAGTNFAAQGTVALSAGWHHFVGVVGSTLAIYIDGVLNASTATSGALVGISALTLGRTHLGEYKPLTFDEFAYYTTALSAAQVAGHYNASTDPISVAVTAPLVGTVSFGADAPTVVGGTDVEVHEVDNIPTASFTAFTPDLLINDGPYIFMETQVITWSMPVPTVSVVSNILIESDRASMNYTMLTPTIFIGDIAFRFISEAYTGFTAADADYLTSLHFGPVLHGQQKVARFRIGNTSSSRANITAYATSVNNLAEMATFSTDGVNYDDAVIIGIDPNGVSDVIWLKLAVTTTAYVDSGTFLIQLENV